MHDDNAPGRRPMLHGLYLITPDELDDERLVERTEPLLTHAACLQYRNKQATPIQRRRQADALRSLCTQRGIPFLVNDDPALAVAVGADGVHLGEHDGAIATARALLGNDAIIGVSCYAVLERARIAAAQGADYVAFGAFFPSPTKPAAPRASMDLPVAARSLGLPLVAIGGITPENAPALVTAGIDMVAVISGVFDAADPLAAARAYAACFS